MDVDKIQQLLGGFKRFQTVTCLCLVFLYMRGPWHVFSPMFMGFDPGHHCTPSTNATLNQSIPWDGEAEAWDTCLMYSSSGDRRNETVGCQNGWTFNFQQGETSFLDEWTLVCDKGYLVELSSTIYMVGTTCGAIFLSPLSDIFGRKRVMLACLWIQAALGFGLAWVNNFITFAVIRFFIGLMNMTIGLCNYVLLSETFPSTQRLLPAISIQFFWALGMMLLALFGYLLRDWRHLEMAISLPNLLSISCIWLLSESFPWLVSKNKLDEAEAVLQRAAKMNKIVLPTDIRQRIYVASQKDNEKDNEKDIEKDIKKDIEKDKVKKFSDSGDTKEGQNESQPKEPKLTALRLLCIPQINIYCFIMFILFLANSLGYFGVLFMTPTLNGDRFLNLFLSAVVEIPAYIIAYICNTCIGRRRPMSVFLLICAAANIGGIFVPDSTGDGSDLTPLKTTLVMIGKFGITGSYSSLYLYAAEIFPTSVRSHALGMASFFENIGSMAAPAMVLVAKTSSYLPLSIFGGLTAVGGILVLFLPETHGRPLPQTVEEVQSWGRETVNNIAENTYKMDSQN